MLLVKNNRLHHQQQKQGQGEDGECGGGVEEGGKWDRGDADQRRGLGYHRLPLKEIQCCVNQTDNLQHHMEINAVKYLEDYSTKNHLNILCMCVCMHK